MVAHAARRVFLSHTREFREYGDGQTFMAAAEAAVSETRDAIVDMAYFGAQDKQPAAFCIEEVQACDVYVGIIGPWYGSVIPDRPDLSYVSYVEIEFEAATERGLPRYVFLLADDADIGAPAPIAATADRQRAFHSRLLNDSGVITARFSTADQLRHEIFKALSSHTSSSVTAAPAPVIAWLGRPPTLGAGFVGREALVDGIRDALTMSRIVVAFGEPGSGKSQLAAEVSHHLGAVGFWAQGAPTAETMLASLAPALGVDATGSEQQRAALVAARLHSMPSETILVIDNLESLDLVNAILKEIGAVRLLVTTRDSRLNLLPPGAAAVHVAPLTEEAAVTLLRSRGYQESGDRLLRQIAQDVGCLPLALESVAVSLGVPGTDAQDVLASMREHPNPMELQIFQDGSGHAIASEGVYQVLSAALDRLTPAVREQIQPLAYLADGPVTLRFVGAVTEVAGGGLPTLISALQRETVVRVEGTRVFINAMFVAAIRASNPEGAVERAVRVFGARVTSVRKDPPALQVEIVHLQRFLSTIESELDEADTLRLAYHNNLALACTIVGRYDDALRLDEETRRVRERVLGAEHRDTLASRSNLAADYTRVGRYDDAAHLDYETLHLMERVLGAEHPDALTSRSNLAAGYMRLGRYEEALRLDEETLELMQDILGEEHPDTLTTRSNLAVDYTVLERFEDALRLDEETLRLRERVLGPEHADTLTSRGNLAADYMRLDRHDEALQLAEETLRLRERIMGREHPDTLTSRSQLAVGYANAGRFEDAQKLDEVTLSLMERVMGADHRVTLTIRANLEAYAEAISEQAAQRV